MSYKNNILPIGRLLQNAGLISDEQLEIALGVQSQHPQMRLGEILSMQEVVEIQTVDFFADKWQTLKQEGQQFPLGYYFKKAFILDDNQIEAILAEQQNSKSKLKFGDTAVIKGWVRKETVDFFLNELAFQAPVLMSLIDLEEYNQQYLHLEKRYANYSLILSRILAWTGGNPTLTKNIGSVFANQGANIPTGMEVNAVDKFIEASLIRNWQTSKIGVYIRSIREKLISNPRCEPILLLPEYKNILLSNDRKYEELKEQQELIRLGIVVNNNNKLRVTNLIFQQIFNQNWIAKTRTDLEDRIQQEVANEVADIDSKKAPTQTLVNTLDPTAQNNQLQEKKSRDSILKANIKNTIGYVEKNNNTEFITKFASLFTLAGIGLFFLSTLVINNYYSSSRQITTPEANNLSEANRIREFCNAVNSFDSASALKNISELEKSKQSISNTPEDFPDNCETVLNNLRVLAVPQLGKEGRVLEAINNLCQIPRENENINEARIWLERWSESPSWGKETKSYLDSIENCPANKLST